MHEVGLNIRPLRPLLERAYCKKQDCLEMMHARPGQIRHGAPELRAPSCAPAQECIQVNMRLFNCIPPLVDVTNDCYFGRVRI
jgi:hypothetical protein